jgi:flagellar M-ring protein FliF
MSSTEEAREQYKPDSQVVRSEQTSEESSGAGGGSQGVPGALSNQPPDPGRALPPGTNPPANAATAGAAPAAQSGSGSADNQSRQATRNFEIDRTVAYTKQPAGRLQRLSVAVLIDNLRTTDADDNVKETPLTEEQIARITTLVRDAVGFDETRGDRVSIVNQSFLPEPSPEAEEAASIPLWERPMVLTFAKLGAGLIALLLLLIMVVKPLLRSLSTVAKAVVEVPAAALPAAGMAAGEGATASGRSGGSMAYEQQIAQARSLVAKDPARVAQVVKDWVQKDE